MDSLALYSFYSINAIILAMLLVQNAHIEIVAMCSTAVNIWCTVQVSTVSAKKRPSVNKQTERHDVLDTPAKSEVMKMSTKLSFHVQLRRKHFSRKCWRPRFCSVLLRSIQFPWWDAKGCKTRRWKENVSLTQGGKINHPVSSNPWKLCTPDTLSLSGESKSVTTAVIVAPLLSS